MQIAILEWEDLIRITGGCLTQDKNAGYLVGYEWRRGKWKCTNTGQNKIMLATNKTGEFLTL